jgi:hypothetical protein
MKQYWNTNTIWFRLALSLGAVWVLYTGYKTFNEYGEAKRANAEYLAESRAEHCSQEVLSDVANIEAGWRLPTIDEMRKCQQDAVTYDAERSWSGRHFVELLAIEQFVEDGVFPAGLFLILIGFGGPTTNIARRYGMWLKTGGKSAD